MPADETTIKAVFFAALEKTSPAERAAYLDGSCAGDADLRREVEVLLRAHDPLKARLVELRFFAGLTLAETARCLGISRSTADRAWRYARAWLFGQLHPG